MLAKIVFTNDEQTAIDANKKAIYFYGMAFY